MRSTIPFNNEAEQSVIGAILLDNRLLTEISDRLSADDFYQVRHQILYGVMMELYRENRPIDLTTITTRLKDRNQFIEVGGLEYLIEISEAVPTTANVNAYVEIVREKSARRLIDTANKISQDTMTSISHR